MKRNAVTLRTKARYFDLSGRMNGKCNFLWAYNTNITEIKSGHSPQNPKKKKTC